MKKRNPMYRVYIRKPSIKHQNQFLQLVRESQNYLNPWAYPPQDKKSFLAYLRRARSKRHACFLICLLDTKEIIGVININEIVGGFFLSGYLGYYSLGCNTGQGLMTEGLGLVIKHAFKKLHLHRLEANIQPENIKSIKLVKRCGFKKEGYSPRYLKIGGNWKDHERWTILKENYH